MAFFIKTEIIKKDFLIKNLVKENIIQKHLIWVRELQAKGTNIKSGFLVDKNKKPGGGGFLIIECNSFEAASEIISNDPMIKNKLVEWELHEWINVTL